MFLKLLLWFQIDKQQFEETIQTLNNLYAEAEKLGGKSYLEGCLACLTAYTIFLCMETHYEKVKQKRVHIGVLYVMGHCTSNHCGTSAEPYIWLKIVCFKA